MEKKGISQCDISLTFKTTKFDSTIVGYIKINEASTALNVIFEYTFDKAVTLDTIKLELKISDRSTKAMSSLQGNMQLESSAYPHINHMTSASYQVNIVVIVFFKRIAKNFFLLTFCQTVVTLGSLCDFRKRKGTRNAVLTLSTIPT